MISHRFTEHFRLPTLSYGVVLLVTALTLIGCGKHSPQRQEAAIEGSPASTTQSVPEPTDTNISPGAAAPAAPTAPAEEGDGPAELSETEHSFLEGFLLASDIEHAATACRTVFGAYPESVNLNMEGPIVLRRAAESTRVAELGASYRSLAADLDKYGHCMKAARIAETPNSWWRSMSPIDPKSEHCLNATDLIYFGSLRLYFYFVQREGLGDKEAELTSADKRIRDLLQRSDDNTPIWDQNFFVSLVTLLHSREGTNWLAKRSVDIAPSQTRRDIDDLLVLLKVPKPDATAIGLGSARVIISNYADHLRGFSKGAP